MLGTSTRSRSSATGIDCSERCAHRTVSQIIIVIHSIDCPLLTYSLHFYVIVTISIKAVEPDFVCPVTATATTTTEATIMTALSSSSSTAVVDKKTIMPNIVTEAFIKHNTIDNGCNNNMLLQNKADNNLLSDRIIPQQSSAIADTAPTHLNYYCNGFNNNNNNSVTNNYNCGNMNIPAKGNGDVATTLLYSNSVSGIVGVGNVVHDNNKDISRNIPLDAIQSEVTNSDYNNTKNNGNIANTGVLMNAKCTVNIDERTVHDGSDSCSTSDAGNKDSNSIYTNALDHHNIVEPVIASHFNYHDEDYEDSSRKINNNVMN